MLQKLGAHIEACYERARDCNRRAGEKTDPEVIAQLRDFERGWTHLARSFECVDSLERFLLSAHKSRTENGNQRAPVQARTPSNVKCDACDITMKLFGIEAHTTIDHCDLLTYVCPRCDEVKAEAAFILQNDVPISENGAITASEALDHSNTFDSETTRLLGSTFDAAWEAIAASERPLDPQYAGLLREQLAKLLIEMAKHADRNPDSLIESDLGRSEVRSADNSDSPER